MYRKLLNEKVDKLAQYGERVWGISEGSSEEKAQKAIDLTERFFNDLGVQTKISHYADDLEGTKQAIVGRFNERGWIKLGEKGSVVPELVGEVLEMAW